MENPKKTIAKQLTNSINRKLVVKNFIAKVLTQSLVKDEEGKPFGFKDKLKSIMNPGTRRRSFESSLQRIKEMSEQMNFLIMFCDEKKMDNVLEKREKEFLSAYQSHMIEVQKELLQLKQKANEKELKLQQDDKILSLEQELAWVREETMKMREEIDNQEALLTDIKLENEELEDDAKFLKHQLKEGKAANTKLKVALSKSHNKYDSLIREARILNKQIPKDLIDRDPYNLGIDITVEDHQSSLMEGSLQEEQQLPIESKPKEITGSMHNLVPAEAQNAYSASRSVPQDYVIDKLLTELYSSGKSKEEIMEQISRFCDENKSRRLHVLNLHKKILAKKQRTKSTLQDQLGNDPQSSETHKNLVYFMQCLQKVREEVSSRTVCTKEVFSKKAKVNLLNLSDKRRIMELLLCKEDILTKVLIKIFRKIKIKDIERKYELEKRQEKYRDLDSEQRTRAKSEKEGTKGRRESQGFRRSEKGQTPSLIQYDGSPPVHLLNQEIRLGERRNITE